MICCITLFSPISFKRMHSSIIKLSLIWQTVCRHTNRFLGRVRTVMAESSCNQRQHKCFTLKRTKCLICLMIRIFQGDFISPFWHRFNSCLLFVCFKGEHLCHKFLNKWSDAEAFFKWNQPAQQTSCLPYITSINVFQKIYPIPVQ